MTSFSRPAQNHMPLYVQLAHKISKAIQKGEFRPNEALPAERVLAEKFSVSRVTARAAIKQLAHQGMVVSRRGSGNYITPILEQPLSRLASFSEELQNSGYTPGSRWLQRTISLANTDELLGLNLLPGARVARMERLRLAGNVVMAHEVSALPASILPDPMAVAGSLYAHLALRNLSPTRARQHIRAVNANARLAEQLGLPEHHAVLFIARLGYSPSNQVVELTHSYCRSEYYDFFTEMQREN